MDVQLISHTQLNPALTPATAFGFSDLGTLFQGKGTPAENVIEYAARCCYRSNARMGTALGFIPDCVNRGHEDVIEHGWATFLVGDYDTAQEWANVNRHLVRTSRRDKRTLVSGNLRVWLDLALLDYCDELLPYLAAIAPAVFGDFLEWQGGHYAAVTPAQLPPQAPGIGALPAISDPQRVALLSYNLPQERMAEHGSATFLFEGISRTCTHQHVRHRAASHSQESARYVSLEKGSWNAIIPPAIAADPARFAVMQDFWAAAESTYAKLRALGVRQEDARFVLPGAAETRIVTTMNFAGWSHFFELRALDKAAQWEIRRMAQLALGMLAQVAPDVFGSQMATCQSRFPAAS